MCALLGNFLFSVLHLMQLFGAPMKLEVSIKGLQGGRFFVPLAIAGSVAERFGQASLGVRLLWLLHGIGL